MEATETQENIVAAGEYRQKLIDRADGMIGLFPVWYGWAIVDAFLAGAEYQKSKPAE